MVPWLKEWTLYSDSLGLNPSYTNSQLCEEMPLTLYVLLPHVQNGANSNTYLSRLSWRLKSDGACIAFSRVH